MEDMKILKPNKIETGRLGFVMHQIQWRILGEEEKFELCRVPWPVLGLVRCAQDIDVARVWAWITTVSLPFNWSTCITEELQKWEAQKLNMKSTPNRLASPDMKATYVEMVNKTIRALKQIYTTLNFDKGHHKMRANGYFDRISSHYDARA